MNRVNEDEKFLFEIAARVSDGVRVDWDSAEKSADSEQLRSQIRELRLVQEVSEVYRNATPPPQADGTPTLMAATITPDSLAAAGEANLEHDPQQPERWGRLEIRERLGAGGFGEVYRAWDPNLDRDVALKLLKVASAGQKRAEEVLAEGRMLARVRHPNVITVHGAETHDGRVGLWMELVRGRTLAQLRREQGRFSGREAALMVIELCKALSAVHAAGLVHRDVKAENAMRDEDGRFLLMDFGAGLDVDSLGGAADQGISGTPLYIAPEVFRGQPATPRSDIYSMGVLLFFLVTGNYPVTGHSLRELKERHDAKHMRLLRDERSDLPEQFVRVVEQALAWDPEQRFATAGQMEGALSASLGIDPVTVASAVKVTDSDATRRRSFSWGKFAVAAIATVGLLALGWLGWQQLGPSTASSGPRASLPSDVKSLGSSYTVEASLFRVSDLRWEQLEPGAALSVGDELALEITSSTPLHVYVFNEDAKGNAYALFPLPGFELQNPLPPSTTHRLPGRIGGELKTWQVTSAGETEHLIVLGSPEPLVEFELELSRLARPQPGAIAMALPEQSKERLRGIGGLAAAPNSGEASRHLFEMARKLAGQAEVVEGVWMREIELANPSQ